MSPDAADAGVSIPAAPWVFLKAFLRDRKTIGSVAPTTRRAARRMAALGGVERAKVVAEFGPGTGAVTRELLAAMPSDARLWAFEVYPPFAQRLAETVVDPRFTVVTASAEAITTVDTGADQPGFDAIISAVPFRLTSPELTHRILDAAGRALRPGAPFVALQYDPRYLSPYLHEHFEDVTRHLSPWNMPPAFLFRARRPRIGR